MRDRIGAQNNHISEINSRLQISEDANGDLEQERDRLKAAVTLAIDTFRRYDMDVETYPTIDHIKMMRNLKGVLAAHDAEVIERFKKALFNEGRTRTCITKGDFDFIADQLRQQAKEVQS